jgi:CRISPR-associated protein Cst2
LIKLPEIELSKIEKNAKFNFMEITFLSKVEKSILNAAGTGGGNLTELKKTTEIDNTQRVFISGTSIKWSIKKYWLEEYPNLVSQVDPKTERSQVSSKCEPSKYIDDDLFGYMDTGKNQKRYAPVKTNGMISLFDIKTDIDNLVRFSPNSDDHSLFDKEISTNVFRSNWAIELDRIGKTKPGDQIESKQDVDIKIEDKERRIKLLLDAIFNLWHRTQQSNYLTNTQPQLMTVFFRQDKSLVVGDKLKIDKDYKLQIDPLIEILKYHKDKITLGYVAAHKSFITNYKTVLETLDELNDDKLNKKFYISDMTELKNKFLSNEFKFIRIPEDKSERKARK